MLKNGLNSKWSINAQGVNPRNNSCFGQDNIDHIEESPYGEYNPWFLTTTGFSGQGASGSAQYFKRNRFPYNGNAYGKVKNKVKVNKGKRTKYTSPLGIEITF